MDNENILSQDELSEIIDEKKSGDGESLYDDNKGLRERKLIIEGDESLRPHDFEHQEKNVQSQFPVLGRIYDRMIRNLEDDMFLMFSKEVRFKQNPFEMIRSRDFLKRLSMPTLINIYRFDPLRSKALVIFNKEAIYESVENYFGGTSSEGTEHDESRELSQTEVKIINILCKKIMHRLEESWLPIKEIKISKTKSETNIQMFSIYSPSDILLVTRFTFSFIDKESSFYIVLPNVMIDPIRDYLEFGISQNDLEDDPNWINALRSELLNVDLKITAQLGKRTISLSELKEWEKGTFIPFEFNDVIEMHIEEFPMFETVLGQYNDRYSLKILSKIDS